MKKKLLTAALLTVTALTLVVASVLGTIAYLTATAGVANTFTVGKVAISMTETAVDSKGVAIPGVARTDKNSYHLTPTQKYIKDPTIFIDPSLTNNDDMYLFVKSHNEIRKIEAGNQPGASDTVKKTSMRAQMEANGWVPVLCSEDGLEIIWVYGTRDATSGYIVPTKVSKEFKQTRKDYQTGVASTAANAGEFLICSEFTIATGVSLNMYNGVSVTFTAFAVQATGVTVENDTTNATVRNGWSAIVANTPNNVGIPNAKNPYDKTLQDEFAVSNGKFFLDAELSGN